MRRQAREVTDFGRWVDHFEQNADTHAIADAAIESHRTCEIPHRVRQPLIESVRPFQLGEIGDGE